MKILAIRGCNLASIDGEFEVDFRKEPLSSAGIFAITGNTGAGKTTILDAMCIALYRESPRLDNIEGGDYIEQSMRVNDIRSAKGADEDMPRSISLPSTAKSTA